MGRHEVLIHPFFGRLPARRVLDCVFAIAPQGNILHCHLEQLSGADLSRGTDAVVYTLTDTPPHDERKRCCLIPPFVKAFPSI